MTTSSTPAPKKGAAKKTAAAKPAAKTPATGAAAKKTPAGKAAKTPSVPAQNTMDLFPAFDTMGVPELVQLSELPPSSELIGAEPEEEFVKNVAAFGVLQPILLLKRQDGSFIVSAGRRRVKAARAAGKSEIPAQIYPVGWVSTSVLTQIENAQRSENVAADLAAIEELIAKGYSETQINEATGKPVVIIRRILTLKKMIPELRAAFNEGKFKDSVAYKIIILGATDQKKLLSPLAKNGKLINKDVDVLIAATIQPKQPKPSPTLAPAAAADEDEEPVAAPEPGPWYEEALELLKQIQALLPPDRTELGTIAEDMQNFLAYEAQIAATPQP